PDGYSPALHAALPNCDVAAGAAPIFRKILLTRRSTPRRRQPWRERPLQRRLGPLAARQAGVVHATAGSPAATVAADAGGIGRRPLCLLGQRCVRPTGIW